MSHEAKSDSLEERLKSHARAFDGLLSIIPAKLYYGEDTSDQWQRKKQTKEQARAAKMAKLDPDNYKSAKDVLDEQQAAQQKRKREEEEEDGQPDQANTMMEKPFDGIYKKKQRTQEEKTEGKHRAPTLTQDFQSKTTNNARELSSDEWSRRKAKLERKKQKKETREQKAKQKAANLDAKREEKRAEQPGLQHEIQEEAINENHEEVTQNGDRDLELGSVDIEAETSNTGKQSLSTATSSPTDHPPNIGSSTTHSMSSSISSIPPSLSSEPQALQKTTQEMSQSNSPVRKPNPAELRLRLQSRIEALRAGRKADGNDGAPARSRQELLEARRQKADAKKAHQKELRQKAKEEEIRKKADIIARGSPLLSPGSPMSQSTQPSKTNFSFGRVQFSDGQHTSADLNAILERKGKIRGPSDPATALIAAENRQSRLATLDESKQADIAEKDSWLNARKRAQGERIRDDTSLLKKTLKRKQKQKKKSEKDWGNRAEGVRTAQEHKQKKREVNLTKRREEKGGKGKKKRKLKARPGFEGSFRAKAPSGGGQRRR